ncbi:hypothetical protein BKA70DRAFT_223928 [Coprinopsis sp. MPI-PUGE-AT-0042]|nr:hypothetical protein BKA70DRAFT_223928 [Coprinopsis sp. MPI-PUGE-AT-0042]
MKGPANLSIAIVRMHHISNPHKFRRLKRYALQSQVSGLAKKGKPGIVVFDGQPQSIKEFLAHARGPSTCIYSQGIPKVTSQLRTALS